MGDQVRMLGPTPDDRDNQVKAALHIRLLARREGWPDRDRDEVLGALGLDKVRGKKK